MLYILRSSDAWKNIEALRKYDGVIHDSLEEISNAKLNAVARIQAGLPIRWGGLVIRRAEAVALPVFLASISLAAPLVLDIAPDSYRVLHVQPVLGAKDLVPALSTCLTLPTKHPG